MRLRTGKSPEWVALNSGDPARFKIKPLTGEDRLALSQQIWMSPMILAMPPADLMRALRAGVVDWDGIIDEDSGEPIKFEPRLLDELPDGTVVNLVRQIHSLSVLGRAAPPEEDEDGNADPGETDKFLEEDEPGN